MKKSHLRHLWKNIKWTNIHITGDPEKKRKKGTENIFEKIIAEYFPNLGKKTSVVDFLCGQGL